MFFVNKIIYHNIKPGFPCPDGLASAWVAAKVFPEAQLIGWEYSSFDLPKVSPEDNLIILDLIDHHKSAQAMLEGFRGGILKFDLTKCGAILTWEYFFPNQPAPVFLQYIQDQDLWQWKLPESEAVREAFASLGRSFELFDKLEYLNQEEFLDFMRPIGQPRLAGYSVPVVELGSKEERFRSDVCAFLYKKFPDAPFTACYHTEKNVEKWDLRSDRDGNNFDVSAIAVSFGGGGHQNSAGFLISI
jgi:uncharacterized protein